MGNGGQVARNSLNVGFTSDKILQNDFFWLKVDLYRMYKDSRNMYWTYDVITLSPESAEPVFLALHWCIVE